MATKKKAAKPAKKAAPKKAVKPAARKAGVKKVAVKSAKKAVPKKIAKQAAKKPVQAKKPIVKETTKKQHAVVKSGTGVVKHLISKTETKKPEQKCSGHMQNRSGSFIFYFLLKGYILGSILLLS